MISTCTFLGDYSVITNVVPDSHLKFELPAGGYVTIRVGSPDGFLVGFGNNYAIAYNASGEDLYVHWNVNSSCLTDEINCRTSTIQCLNCNGCVAPNLGVSVDLATSFGPFQGTLSNCNLVGEYNEITGIPTGSVELTTTAGYMTVREGTPSGPLLGAGFSPLEVPTSGQNIYVHYSSNNDCGNNPSGCLSTTAQCTSCLFPDPNDGDCFLPGEFGSVSIDPGSSENILISNCNFQNEHSEIIGTLGKDLRFTSTQKTYVTVRGGVPNGPVVFQGITEGNGSIGQFDVEFDKLYAHWTVDQFCNTATNCIQAFVQCLSCGTCPDGFKGDPCDDGDPNTFGTTLQFDCSCGGGFLGPVNDICAGILPNLTCGEEVVGNTDTANPPEFEPSGCGFGGQGGNDVWYTFEADGTSSYDLSLRLGPEAGFWVGNLYVYEGNCEAPVEIACTVPLTSGIITADLGNLNAGTYYVQVFSESVFQNSFRLGLNCAQPCENPFPAVDESSLVTFFGVGNIITEWSPVPGQIGCQVQVRFAGGSILGSQIVGGANADGFNIPLSVLQPGTNYEWRVRCGCSQNPLVAGPFSSWQPFTTFPGITMNSNPNPTEGSSNVTFNLSESSYTTLEVFDMNGRMIKSLFAGNAQAGQEYQFEFNGFGLPNGVYIFRLTTEQESANEKLLIVK
ncbi:MAG: T9SS type A sorting domain-containing protein [Flavobacteriales bacterium]|nr:T9SS type A sorting domain-containing protein [Flavobacteriales bacterium]